MTFSYPPLPAALHVGSSVTSSAMQTLLLPITPGLAERPRTER